MSPRQMPDPRGRRAHTTESQRGPETLEGFPEGQLLPSPAVLTQIQSEKAIISVFWPAAPHSQSF